MKRLGRVIERQELVRPTAEEIEHSRVSVLLKQIGDNHELLITTKTTHFVNELKINPVSKVILLAVPLFVFF